MVLANRITALVVLVLGVVLGINSMGFPLIAEFGPGPGFWPAWLALAWIILAIVWFVQSGTIESRQPFFASTGDAGRVAVCIGIFMGYLLILDRVGFVVSTALYLAVVLWLFEKRGLVGSIITSLAIPVGLSLLFDSFLKVGLPSGPLIP